MATGHTNLVHLDYQERLTVSLLEEQGTCPRMAFRILVVDDHELIRRGLRLLIQNQQGWEVCGEAEDGDEAVAQAAALRPDVIILDLAMPRMDGLEAAVHIRKATPIPIILHTSYDSPELQRAAQGLGIVKVTRKSSPTDLVAELERLFRAALHSSDDRTSSWCIGTSH